MTWTFDFMGEDVMLNFWLHKESGIWKGYDFAIADNRASEVFRSLASKAGKETDLVALFEGRGIFEAIAELPGADEHGFMLPAHPKTNPVDGTEQGFFVVGCCQGPRDIPDTVAQASAAAARLCGFFSGGVAPPGAG